MNWLKTLYFTHVQKILGTALGTLAFVDLTGYRDSIVAFTGERGYAGIRLVGAVAIVWRAAQATHRQNEGVTPQ
jgi:hypothetical protein